MSTKLYRFKIEKCLKKTYLIKHSIYSLRKSKLKFI